MRHCATMLLCCIQCETSKASEISMDHIKWPGTEKMEKALTASRTSVVLDGWTAPRARRLCSGDLWRHRYLRIRSDKHSSDKRSY